MDKRQLAQAVALKTGIHETEVLAMLNATNEAIKETLSKGESIFMRGFGSYVPKYRAPKLARNISKGTGVMIDAHYSPTFKPSKEFKEALKDSKKLADSL